MTRPMANGLLATLLLSSITQAAEPAKSVDDFNTRHGSHGVDRAQR